MPIEGPVEVVPAGSVLAAGVGEGSGRAVVKERRVAAPREEVFRLFTTSEGVSAWLSEGATVELRIGGAFEVLFAKDQPPGKRGSEGCRVLAFLPPRLLCFTWNAPPHLDRVRDQRTWVVVELADVDRHTEVTLTHAGWPATGLADDPQWEEAFAYFDAAWGRVLDALEDHLAPAA